MEGEKNLLKPPAHYRPLALWEWTSPPSTKEIEAKLFTLKDSFSGVIIKPPSEEKVREALSVAKKINLPLFLALPIFNPFPAKLSSLKRNVKEGETVEVNIEGKPLWVGALPLSATSLNSAVLLNDFLENDTLRWTPPAGEWTLLIIYVQEAKGENLLRLAQGWLESLKDFIPPFAGFYIPQINLFPFPWADNLHLEFQRRRGYPLQPLLPLLSLDLKEEERFRHDFRQTVLEIAQEQIKSLTSLLEERGLRLIASLPEGENLWNELFLLYRLIHIPVVRPSLLPLVEEFRNTIVASACDGKPVYLEVDIPYGSPLEDLKKKVDLYASQGIGGFIYKFYFPPHQEFTSLWEEPFFPLLSSFFSYQARLNLLASLKRSHRVVMLLPRRSLWAHQRLGEEDEIFRAINRDLFFLCELLHKIHYDFLFVDEDELPRLQGISTLILPSTTTLNRSTLRWLEDFYEERGGNLVALGMLPFRSQEGEDVAVENAVRALFKMNVKEINRSYTLASPLEVAGGESYAVGRIHPISGGKIYAYQPALNIDREEALRQTRQILKGCLPADLDVLAQNILCLPMKGSVFLIFNRDIRENDINAMLPLQGIPYLLDIEEGKEKKIWQYSLMEDGRMIVPLSLPAQSLLVIQIKEGKEPHIDRANFYPRALTVKEGEIVVEGWQGEEEPFALVEIEEGERRMVEGERGVALKAITLLEEWEIEPQQPNFLPLLNWRYKQKGGWLSSLSVPKSPHRDWEEVAPDIKLEGEVWYQAFFSVEEVGKEWELHIEAPPSAIFLNGSRIQWRAEGMSVSPFLKKGGNFLTLLVNHHQLPSLPRVTIRGDFSLLWREGEWNLAPSPKTLKVGSWTEQGYPFYQGTMAYKGKCFIPTAYLGAKVVLDLGRVGEVAEVEVNGRYVGARLYPPWRLEIGEFLEEGDNQIVIKVTNCASPSLSLPPSGLLEVPRLLAYPLIVLRLYI